MSRICTSRVTYFIGKLGVINAPASCAPLLVQRRHNNTAVVRDQADNLAAYKRGTGGRSSFSGIVVTVFGGSGFIGRYVVNRLAKIGSQVICPHRCDPYFMKDLRLLGDLGQVLCFPFDIRDEERLRKVMQYSNTVINLIGRDFETKNFSFDDVHVDGARRIARIARECGVEKLIHFSHINAQPNPPSFYRKGGSKLLRAKHWGEMAVREEFPDATIFRPADVYGPEDRFLRYWASAWRRNFDMVPLWKRGEKTIKYPVFFGNVAEGVVNAVKDPTSVGKTFEIVGPKGYYLSDLVDYFYRCMRWERKLVRMYMNPIFRLKVAAFQNIMLNPLLTLDKLERDGVSDVLTGLPDLADLGVNLMALEDRAPFELKPYRRHLYYEESVGEFPSPEPPPALPV